MLNEYGSTGIMLPTLGLGAAQIGDARVVEADAAIVLNRALDLGVTLIDTAPGYGLSEERIGRLISHRRQEFVLSTKLGYGVEGVPEWTGAAITAGVERALRLMKTDVIDIAHLHSCPLSTLAETDVIDALERAKKDGKVRAIAYSGENEALHYAIHTGRFDGFMASLNLFDQRVIAEVLPKIIGKGFIAKRPAANHPWRFESVPTGEYCEVYWHRLQAMQLNQHGQAWGEMALRFAANVDGVSSSIIGTANLHHLEDSVKWIAAGALDVAHVDAIRARFQACDQDWVGQI